MDNSPSLQGFLVALQGMAVGLSNWFISALPTAVLLMSATLTALQLYVFVRDKLKKGED